MAEPIVSIVVLTWNRLVALKECLTNIINRTNVPYVLYVVNNGSTDGTVEYLNDLQSRGVLKAIHLDQNYGVTARNYAFKLASTPYIAQVDDDVGVSIDWAQTCLARFEKNPKLGIACSQGAHIVDWLSLQISCKEELVDCATGFFMFFKNIGVLYDDAFAPFWHEEIDFSFEFKIRGYEIAVVPGVSDHKCRRNTLDEGLEHRNFLYVKDKWESRAEQLRTPTASPPIASPPVASPPVASPPVASPPVATREYPFVIDDTVKQFHKLYYGNSDRTWGLKSGTKWLGHTLLKCPLDLWIYQEIFFELKPELIIETGTHSGGSALFWASLCDLVNKGQVVSIDVKPQATPPHPRVTYLIGSSVDPIIVDQVRALQKPALVNLDSLHLYGHVAEELKIYSEFVPVGGYLIVEDTNLNGFPIPWDGGLGPYEATQDFLSKDSRFVVDSSREKFYMTFNPSGYLKRVK